MSVSNIIRSCPVPNIASPLFLVVITDVITSTTYAFSEYWINASTGSFGQKIGGISGDSYTPGYAPSGVTFVEGNLAIARLADGIGGTGYELLPIGSSSSSLTVQTSSGSPSYTDTITLEFDSNFTITQPTAGTVLVSFTGSYTPTGTANTLSGTPSSGSGLQSFPIYVTDNASGSGYTFSQSTVPNLGASTSTGMVRSYTLDNSSGTPQFTFRQLTNGTSGGNGYQDTLSPTQRQVSYSLGGTSGSETITASGGAIQRTGSNMNLTGYTIPVSQLTGTTLPTSIITSSLTTLGTIATAVWNASVIAGQYGGTGVANTGSTITLGGNLTTSGAYPLQFTLTGSSNVTLPTTGTLVNTSITSLSSLATVGTLTSGEVTSGFTIDATNVTWSSTIPASALPGGPSGAIRTEGTVSATGSNQATAAAISASATKVSTPSGGTGVILPSVTAAIITIWNTSLSLTLDVYPPSGASLGAIAVNSPLSIATNSIYLFTRISATQWSYVALAAA